jgi:hypothetical protein
MTDVRQVNGAYGGEQDKCGNDCAGHAADYA